MTPLINPKTQPNQTMTLSLHVQSPLGLATEYSKQRSLPAHSTIFAKPSHFIFHAKRTSRNNRFAVSCVSEKPETTHPPKLDRRNMLLGLGGATYGASNLIAAPSQASPIQPPVLDKCSPPTDVRTGEVLDAKCCLKSSAYVTDYRLPQVYHKKIRPSAHKVSREYAQKYNLAIERMKQLPKDDPRSFMQQANIHCAYCNNVYGQPGTDKNVQVHFSWLFFPFHRWYLYFYERILGKMIDDPTFALPFWNWDNPKGMTIPPIFWDEHGAPALYDGKRDPSHKPPAVVDLGLTGSADPLQVVANNLTIMHTEMIRGNSDVIDFMGCPVREGGASTMAMQGTSERGSHTSVHVWVGDPRQDHREDMGNFYSAGRDPLFYCHHANVDRMWALWRDFLPNPKIRYKEITDSDYLNASFLFYDEDANLVRVYVKDAIDYRKMGYDFERIDLPWMDYRPSPQSKQAKEKRASKKVMPIPLINNFPLVETQTTIVQKTKKGATREKLVINFSTDITKLLKFDVFVNDEDDNVNELDKAAYAGTYAQVPHHGKNSLVTTSISLSLTSLYEDMDVADDETVHVTLVPRHHGPGITIHSIKLIEEPEPKPSIYVCTSA